MCSAPCTYSLPPLYDTARAKGRWRGSGEMVANSPTPRESSNHQLPTGRTPPTLKAVVMRLDWPPSSAWRFFPHRWCSAGGGGGAGGGWVFLERCRCPQETLWFNPLECNSSLSQARGVRSGPRGSGRGPCLIKETHFT